MFHHEGSRRRASVLLALGLLAGGLILPASAVAAVSCTSSSPGYATNHKTVSINPPVGVSGLSLTGQIWVKECTDGAGISYWGRGYEGAVYDYGNYTLSSAKLGTTLGDDCETWVNYNLTLFNVSKHIKESPGWRWRPAFVCGPRPIYHDKNRAWGTLTKNGLFSWDFDVHL